MQQLGKCICANLLGDRHIRGCGEDEVEALKEKAEHANSPTIAFISLSLVNSAEISSQNCTCKVNQMGVFCSVCFEGF